MAVKSIITAVDTKYVEELEEDYVGYKNQTIKTLVTQLHTWYIITNKENMAIKYHFLAPWSATFARQLDRCQVECEYHGVTITDNDKLDHFVAQMYACGIFESKFLDDWEETSNKLWGGTPTHFTQKFKKERRKLERKKSQNNY